MLTFIAKAAVVVVAVAIIAAIIVIAAGAYISLKEAIKRKGKKNG